MEIPSGSRLRDNRDILPRSIIKNLLEGSLKHVLSFQSESRGFHMDVERKAIQEDHRRGGLGNEAALGTPNTLHTFRSSVSDV